MTFASAYAPGRVELLGNHTDYNLGVVLGAAIDRGLTATGMARENGFVRLRSTAFPGCVETPVAQIRRREREAWANYSLGVVEQFLRAGHKIGGFSCEISGDLPLGCGLASSAALEVATAYLLSQLYDLSLTPLALAKLCQRAENEFVGVRSGLLDQVTSIFGKADHVIYFDCQSEEIRAVPFPEEFALVIADSGMKHSLIQSEYEVRWEECSTAARALNVASLREVTLRQLDKTWPSLDPILHRRARHVVGENERVWQALEALKAGDIPAIGALMNASHESSRINFENSTPELDQLVAIANSIPGVLGSRLTGGGFGGATVTLVNARRASAVADRIAGEYARRSGIDAQLFVCRCAAGAAALEGRKPK